MAANNDDGWVIGGTVEAEGNLNTWWQTHHGPMNTSDRREMEDEVGGMNSILQRVVLSHALNAQRGEIPVFLFRTNRTVRVYQWSLEHARARQKIAIFIYKLEEDGTLKVVKWGKRQIFDADKPQDFPSEVRQLLLSGDWPFEDEDEGNEEIQVYAERTYRRRRPRIDDDDTEDGYELRPRENPVAPPIEFDPKDGTFKIVSPTDSNVSDLSDLMEKTTLSSDTSDSGEEDDDDTDGLLVMFQPFFLTAYRRWTKDYPKRSYRDTAIAILSLLSSWQEKEGTWNDYVESNIHDLLKDKVSELERANEQANEQLLRNLEKARAATEEWQRTRSNNMAESDDDDDDEINVMEEVYYILSSRYGIAPGSVTMMIRIFDLWIREHFGKPQAESEEEQNERIITLFDEERLTTPLQIARYFKKNLAQPYQEFIGQSFLDKNADDREKPYNRKEKYTADDIIFKPSKVIRKIATGRIPSSELISGTESTNTIQIDREALRKSLLIKEDLDPLFRRLRQAQLKVVRNVVGSHGQLIVAPTGFGKTLCIIFIAACFLVQGEKVIIAVKRTTYQQFISTIELYFSGRFMRTLLDSLVTHYEFYEGNGLDNVDLAEVARDIPVGAPRANAAQVEIEQENEDAEDGADEDVETPGAKRNRKSYSRKDIRDKIVLLDECHLYSIDYFRTQNRGRNAQIYSSMNTYKVMLQCAIAKRVYLFSATPCRSSGNDLLSLLCMVKRMAPTPRTFNEMSPLLNYTPGGDPRIRPLSNGENPIHANWKCLVTSVLPGTDDTGFATLETRNVRVRMSPEEEENYRRIERDGVFNETTRRQEAAWSSFGRHVRQACYTQTKMQQAMHIIFEHFAMFNTKGYKELVDKALIKPRVLIYAESIDYAQEILRTLRHNFKPSKLTVFIPSGRFNDKNGDYVSFNDVRGAAQICIITEAGITGYDAPALTCIIAMNSFWSPSSSSQLQGRLVRRNRHDVFKENNLPTVFRAYTLQAVLTAKLDPTLRNEIANITDVDALEVTDRTERNYTFDERQQVVMFKKAGWIRAAMVALHEVANADEESENANCLTDEEQEGAIQKNIVTTRTRFLQPIVDSAAPPAAPPGPTVITLDEGQATIINPLSNRPVKVNTATYRKLIKDKVIEIIKRP